MLEHRPFDHKCPDGEEKKYIVTQTHLENFVNGLEKLVGDSFNISTVRLMDWVDPPQQGFDEEIQVFEGGEKILTLPLKLLKEVE